MNATAIKTHGVPKGSLENHEPGTDRSPPADHPCEAVQRLQDGLAKDLVKFFKLLADETRLRILYCLMQREELHVRALCDLLGLSQPSISHHLGMLRNAGIVEPRRDGKHNFYRILPGNYRRLLGIVVDSIPDQARTVRFDDLQLGDHRPSQPR